MKRLKLAIVAVLLGVMAMGLCSCNYLDQLKLRRLDVQYEPGTANIVSLTGQGHTYTPILQTTELGFFNSSQVRYVVTPDVPLLLISDMGSTFPASADGKLVKVGGTIFASDEMTAAEIAAVKAVKLDRYVMLFWDEGMWGMSWELLPDDVTAAINATLKGYAHNGMPSESDIPAAGWQTYDTTDTFMACDANQVFSGAEYQFSIYDTGQIFLMDWYEYAFYEVPEEYYPVVKAFYEDWLSKGDGMAPMPVAMVEGY